MRLMLLVFVALFALAPLAVAGDRTCPECNCKFAREHGVRWGLRTYCSDSCRRQAEHDDRNRGWTCRICGDDIPAPRRDYVSGDTRYITIGEPAKQELCKLCRHDIATGKIDPDNPPAHVDRDPEDYKYDNKWSPKRKEEKVEKDEEAHSGFGAMKWVIVIAVALLALLRWFLKQ